MFPNMDNLKCHLPPKLLLCVRGQCLMKILLIVVAVKHILTLPYKAKSGILNMCIVDAQRDEPKPEYAP
jgi:hypothetical protein